MLKVEMWMARAGWGGKSQIPKSQIPKKFQKTKSQKPKKNPSPCLLKIPN
jgi:hypothetical protein